MNDASTASIERSAAREGKRWKLVTEVQGDSVKVCDLVYEAEVRGGFCDVRKVPRKLCTVDEDAPFSAALNNRVQNGETNMAARYQRSDELRRQAVEKKSAEIEHQIRSEWKTRNRITVIGGRIFIPEGLAERQAYRQRVR
jgi:hypothetical protein